MTKKISGNPTDPDDPWAVAQTNGYDVDQFYTRSTDGKGHSENVQVRLSPAMMANIQELIASRQIPYYKSAQDVIRDAIVHRAKYVQELIKSRGNSKASGEWERIIAAEALESRMDQVAEHVALGQRILDKTAKRVKDLLDADKRSDAWDLVEEFEEIARQWREETVYRHMVGAVEQWKGQLTGNKTGSGLRRVN